MALTSEMYPEHSFYCVPQQFLWLTRATARKWQKQDLGPSLLRVKGYTHSFIHLLIQNLVNHLLSTRMVLYVTYSGKKKLRRNGGGTCPNRPPTNWKWLEETNHLLRPQQRKKKQWLHLLTNNNHHSESASIPLFLEVHSPSLWCSETKSFGKTPLWGEIGILIVSCPTFHVQNAKRDIQFLATCLLKIIWNRVNLPCMKIFTTV